MTGLPDPAVDRAGFVLAVADLREKRATEAAPGPWCPAWTHQAIRHVQRNVDIDCSDHDDDGGAVSEDCRRFGRYDGEHIAAEANPAHALAEVALWRAVITAEKCFGVEFRPVAAAVVAAVAEVLDWIAAECGRPMDDFIGDLTVSAVPVTRLRVLAAMWRRPR